jgi:hypothetical protein
MIKKLSNTSQSILVIPEKFAPSIIASLATNPKTKTANKLKGISLKVVFFLTVRGYTIADNHKISNMFAILLPNTFHIAIPALHLTLAIIFTKSSGAEVPKATIVNHITKSETLNFFAILDAHSTRISAHLIRTTNPTINKK